MRLYIGKVTPLAQEVVQTLMSAGVIEVAEDKVLEVVLDVESVLREYIRTEREITEKARDIIAAQKRSHSELKKIRAQLARERSFGIDEEAIEYLITQIIEALVYSRNVEEVYGADNEIAVHLAPVLRRHLAADEELDAEVRKRIKNLQEGTLAWDLQYRKVMEELRRTRRLE